MRDEAAVLLGAIKHEKAVAPLVQALNDEHTYVQGSTARALVKIGEPAVDALIQALQERGWDVKCGAAGALGEIGAKRTVGPLVQALEHNVVSDVRWKAAQALGNMAGLLVKAGYKRPVKSLIEALGDKDSIVRQVAAEALGEIGDPMAIEPLVKALKSEDGNVYAAVALAEIGEPALDALIKALEDRDENVRRVAAFGLGRTGDKRAIEPLIQALKDESSGVQFCAAEALARMGDATGIELLTQYLRGANDHIVRFRAAYTLGQIGDERAVKPLKLHLRDPDPNVRVAAKEALEMIQEGKK